MPIDPEKHRAEQQRYWRDTDADHFNWQLKAPCIAPAESALLEGIVLEPHDRLLEIGCGEGANLHRLKEREPQARLVGTDFSVAKARFAQRALSVPAACADATALPFVEESFDAVLVRDLLHHIAKESRARVLEEARRVLRAGGCITLIEPNGRNPLVLLQAALIRAERGVLHSTAELLRAELGAAGFRVESVNAQQPLPISRVVLHYRFGASFLGAVAPVAWVIERFERAAAVLPRSLWAYVVAQGRRIH